MENAIVKRQGDNDKARPEAFTVLGFAERGGDFTIEFGLNNHRLANKVRKPVGQGNQAVFDVIGIRIGRRTALGVISCPATQKV